MSLLERNIDFHTAVAEWIEGYVDTLKEHGMTGDLLAYNISYGLNEMFRILQRKNLVKQINHVRLQGEDNMLYWDISILSDKQLDSTGSIVI